MDNNNDKTTHSGWGGSRKGAGRPPKKEKKMIISFRASQETKERWMRAKANGHDMAGQTERLVRGYLDSLDGQQEQKEREQ